MRVFLFALFAVLAVLSPCSSSGEIVDKIVAIVNDDIVTLSDVQRVVRVEKQGRFASVDEYFRGQDLKDKLSFFIDNMLIQQQAKKLKIEVSEKEVEGVVESIKKQNLISEQDLKEQLAREKITYKAFLEGLRMNLLRSKVLSRTLSGENLVTEADLRAYYQANLDQFRSEEYRLQQVFISARRQDAAARGQNVYNQLVKGVPFEELARDFSDDPSGAQGGDIGYVRKEELIPELRQALSLLVQGSYSHPISTGYGVHIVKLLEIRKSEAPPFDSVKDEVNARLLQKESERRYKEYIAKLRASAYIEVKI
jgi:peptidyl-prolyl cis-trans isomerase SurA